MNSNRSSAALGLVVGGVMLLIALARLPYGYYVLMRWVVCAACAYAAWVASEERQGIWVWVLGALALLFNPIIPFRMHRSDWQAFDMIGAAIMFVASAGLGRQAQTCAQ